ncbi:hypothetical protein JX265_010635 [Neoarthrinium moseri]|uniref:Uncharacterized protein n=1 Tax=Neoarthrinium moseri TaxID=1658444 RepID=A0A9P9WE11_9PEZI|nr:hypothetical protein JX265_010635 [Neoarthrinium moseri]
MASHAIEDVIGLQERHNRDKELMHSRHAQELKDLENNLKTSRDDIIRSYMAKLKAIDTQDLDLYLRTDAAKKDEIRDVEVQYERRRAELQQLHMRDRDEDLMVFAKQVPEIERRLQQIRSSPQPLTAPKGNGMPHPQSCQPQDSSNVDTSPAPRLAQVHPVYADNRHRLMFCVQMKRKLEPSEAVPEKRPRVDGRDFDLPRTLDALIPGPPPLPSSSSPRIVTYDQVRRNAIDHGHWDMIVEHPHGSQKWYVLYCDEHEVHFRPNAIQAAAKHLNSQRYHSLPDRNYESAVKHLGYQVIDCTAERQQSHNADVEQATANGYEPVNRLAQRGIKVKYPFEKEASPQKTVAKKSKKSAPQSTAPAKPQKSTQLGTATRLDYKGSPMKANRPAITHPKPFHLYYGDFEDEDAEGVACITVWPVLVLAWDDQTPGGLLHINPDFTSLQATELLADDTRPSCYVYSEKGDKIVGWAPGYEDGGRNVKKRKFPVMFFDEESSFYWMPVKSLAKFPIDRKHAPKVKGYSESAYNKAREFVADREGFDSWEDRQEAKDAGQLRKWEPGKVAPATWERSPKAGQMADSQDSVDTKLEALKARGGEVSGDDDYADEDGDSVDDSTDEDDSDEGLATQSSDRANGSLGPTNNTPAMSLPTRAASTPVAQTSSLPTKKKLTARRTQPQHRPSVPVVSQVTSSTTTPTNAATNSVPSQNADNDDKKETQQAPHHLYELAELDDGVALWTAQMTKKDECLRVFRTEDGKQLHTDEALRVVIDPNVCESLAWKDVSNTSEFTITQENQGRQLRLVFGQSENSKVPYPMKQARQFLTWLRTERRKLGKDLACTYVKQA